MRKHSKLLAGLLALCMAGAVCAGCEVAEEEETKPAETPSNVIMVNDFERFDTCFSPMRAANYFGIVNMNKDARYVKSGAASAQLKPMGDWFESPNAKPTLRIPFDMKKKGVDYGDFRKVVMLTAELYNASDFDVTCRAYLSYTGGYTAGRETVLAKNAWTRLTYSIDRALLDITGDITEIGDFNLEFPVVEKDGVVPELYLDDLKLITTADAFQPIQMNFEPDHILDFEENWEVMVMPTTSGNGYFDPKLSLNTDARYASGQKGNSLKVDFVGKDDSVTTWSYAGFYLPRAVLKNSGFDQKKGTDTFSFDVYNACSTRQRLMVALNNDAGKPFFKDIYIYLNPNEWRTITYTFTELNKGYPGETPPASYGDGATASGGGTEKIASIYMHWDYFGTDPGERTLYFDSFRMTTDV